MAEIDNLGPLGILGHGSGDDIDVPFLQLRHAAGGGNRLEFHFYAHLLCDGVDEIDVVADDTAGLLINVTEGGEGILAPDHQHPFLLCFRQGIAGKGGFGGQCSQSHDINNDASFFILLPPLCSGVIAVIPVTFALHRRQKLAQELLGPFMLRPQEKIFGRGLFQYDPVHP